MSLIGGIKNMLTKAAIKMLNIQPATDKTITIKINTNNNNFNKISLIKFFNYLIQQICKGSGFRSFRFFQMNKTKQFITL